MEKKVIVACAAVGFLGIVSAVLAFAAEGTRTKASDVLIAADACVYPKKRSAAVGLGFVSALTLLTAQLIINALTGCFCCKTHQNSSGNSRTIGLITFIISWVTFVAAFLMLVGGAAIDNQHGVQNNYRGTCYIIKPGVFTGAAILVLATVSLGLISYISLSSSKNNGSWGPQSQGIAMGIPAQSNQPGSWAPQQNQGHAPNNQPPVFVHEDTYRRQQYP